MPLGRAETANQRVGDFFQRAIDNAMKLQFFTIPTLGGDEANQELNRFLSNHRVVSIDRQFVANGDQSHWSICVTYLDSNPQAQASAKKPRIDYRDVLSESEFALFSQLRSLRKMLAEQEGVPVYAVFTNEQLASMIRERVTSKHGLEAIDGVGDSRIDKFGEQFLIVLNREIPRLDQTGKSDETATGHA